MVHQGGFTFDVRLSCWWRFAVVILVIKDFCWWQILIGFDRGLIVLWDVTQSDVRHAFVSLQVGVDYFLMPHPFAKFMSGIFLLGGVVVIALDFWSWAKVSVFPHLSDPWAIAHWTLTVVSALGGVICDGTVDPEGKEKYPWASRLHTFALSPSIIICYESWYEGKQAHCAMHWPCVHGFAASSGLWLHN